MLARFWESHATTPRSVILRIDAEASDARRGLDGHLRGAIAHDVGASSGGYTAPLARSGGIEADDIEFHRGGSVNSRTDTAQAELAISWDLNAVIRGRDCAEID